MDDNKLDFLSGPPAQIEPPGVEERTPPTPNPEPQPQPAPEPPAPDPAVSQERGPDGKFVAKPQSPLSEKETVGFYKAMQEERDKRQALERKLAELEAKAAPVAPVDPQVSEMQALRVKTDRLEANLAHGADTVKAAYDWAFKRCDEDPVFNSRVASMIASMGNPYEVAVALRKEADALDALKSPQSQPPQPEPTPPRSLADAPGNGAAGKAHVPVGPGEGYRSIF